MADLEKTTTDEASEDTHASGHQKASYDDVNTTAIVIVGLISALFTFLTIAFVQGLYYKWNNSYVIERSNETENKPVVQMVEKQKSELEGDEEKGTISIEDAMKKVLAKYKSEDSEH